MLMRKIHPDFIAIAILLGPATLILASAFSSNALFERMSAEHNLFMRSSPTFNYP